MSQSELTSVFGATPFDIDQLAKHSLFHASTPVSLENVPDTRGSSATVLAQINSVHQIFCRKKRYALAGPRIPARHVPNLNLLADNCLGSIHFRI
jgi:glycerol-3-phosphate O-acyltransferase